ncbi:PREDICTED: uncharacterized protein LOC105556478 [Vollenhovia emeryi]|uniref:uncharacterized protein LOC105556478 n=1 Tax=Vollenhovia emeryi TaxID=411798 RepID=UPI0005F48051|nr:PREDICTED: uncharacterized protein LOC105556478 [Vollenhovia emeryi]
MPTQKESDASRLTSLNKERGIVKGQVTRIHNYFTDLTIESADPEEIAVREQKLRGLWDQFEIAQAKIEDIQAEDEDPNQSEEQKRERSEFETTYYHSMALAKRLLAPTTPRDTPGASRPLRTPAVDEPEGVATSSIKLPQLNLPKFDGNYSQWLSFRDSFQALIDECNTLSDIQKFYYLRSSLQGVAAQVINSLETTADNYHEAWELLKTRFENKRLMLHHHVHSLFDITSIPKESASQLRKLVDDILKHLRALKTLGQPTDQWDCLMIYLVSSKLDAATRRKWESSITTNTPPTFKQLTDFLTQHCSVLETLQPAKLTTNKVQAERKDKKPEQTTSCVSTKDTSKACPTFIRLRNAWRADVSDVVKNTLIHYDRPRVENQSEASPSEGSSIKSDTRNNKSKDQSDQVSLSQCVARKRPQGLLSTALVLIYDKSGRSHVCRALLDSGSQSNLITTQFCDKLQLTKYEADVSISGVNLNRSTVKKSVHATIKSRVNEFKSNLSFLILDQITENLPMSGIDIQQITIPDNIVLADTSFHKPGKIDILLGAGVFWRLLCVGQLHMSGGQLILQKTKLGWIVSGNILPTKMKHADTEIVTCGVAFEKTLEEQEQLCEEEFKTTHRRDQDGRFIVGLSFRQDIDQLGESRSTAVKRLRALNRRLDRQPELKMQYKAFLDEYLTLGHMTEVNSSDVQNETLYHYIPHHAVLKESSTTTKLRVVFDASCKTSTNVSLNDILRVGPTIQQDLFAIVARFRQHQYVITADIIKMFRQIQLRDDQRDLQRILWRSDWSQPIKEYRLNTITYGLATAPFLAIRCLHEVAYQHEQESPFISNIILNDFYVDDLLTGGDTIEQVKIIKKEISRILLTGRFPLRKWNSNTPAIIIDEIENTSADDQPIGDEVKTLGHYWNPLDDVLRYKINTKSDNTRITKRTLLSLISQIYDPLGLVGPACIRAKIILQQLWRLKIGWDESLPADLHTMWVQYYSQLSSISSISIPRLIVCANPKKIELHGFCDASESAYGACIFIRSLTVEGEYLVRLHSAKSRVAPLKVISIPRLELCGALLLARLVRKVLEALTLSIDEIHYWSDSQVTLAWIAGEPTEWKTFVANRVAEIQRLSNKNCWHHVSSKDNPADVLSRGINPEQLENFRLWWNGPPWLSQHIDIYHKSKPIDEEVINTSVVEAAEQIPVLNNVIQEFDLLERYSSWSKLKNIMVYCLRFIRNVKQLLVTRKSRDSNNRQSTLNPTIKEIQLPSVEELEQATTTILRLNQARDFPQEIRDLTSRRKLQGNSKLLSLNPFIDDNGLIRVGGRLRQAPLPYTQRFPVVLSSGGHITKLIIRDQHVRNLHAGLQALLSIIGEKYWILSARSAVRRVLHGCIICFRTSAKNPHQLMGDLPECRVTPCRAFLNVGVDYGGPFNVKVSRNKSSKAYLCLFVCLATRAVHLELVTDLSTAAFLNALRRFIARRGKCANIYSDNGSNFVGANNELKALLNLLRDKSHQSEVSQYLSDRSIKWHFIPPYSPHMGGIWEAGIKSAKTHLKRVLGNPLVTFEEFYTLLTEIEAILNSRPLTPMSSDPNDFSALTPGHFLIGSSLTAIPQVDLQDTVSNRLTRYQLLIKLLQHFWSRWSREVLSQMQPRNKWKSCNLTDSLKPDTLIILRDDRLPPLQWKLGRITEIHPGKDKLVRVVSIKTSNGIVQRSLSKICIVPTLD